ncbi:MAG: hypothetical protein Q4D93_03275 [Porphyromonas sp.]|nr:hypothetical protein [Porphyromonas sp.]
MKNYSSRPFIIKKDIKSVYELFKSPRSAEHFLSSVDKSGLPAKEIQVTDDALSFNAKMVGKVVLTRTEAIEPNLIRYTGTQSPVPLEISISLNEETPETTKGQVSVDANIPSFLAGMVSNQLEPAMEKLADMMEELDVDRFLGRSKE